MGDAHCMSRFRARAFAALRLLLCLGAGSACAGTLEQRGQIHWQWPTAAFGGLSGIEVLEDGTRVLTVSDRGTLFVARATRQDGVLTGLALTARAPLRGTKGETPRAFLENAEALAVPDEPDRTTGFYVAYEAWPRVWYYDRPDGLPEWTHPWDRFWSLLGNEGLEALAISPTGQLIAISERSEDPEGAFPAYRRDATGWQHAFDIPRKDGFLVSGADFGPDGALYVLERKFRWYAGFSTRIRRLDLGPDGISEDRLLLDSPPGQLDNSEGISVWRAPDGLLHLTVVSDDNFSPLQRTLVTEFVLIE